jgi:predicted DNA-binding protein
MIMMSVKFQIVLPDELAEELRNAAQRFGLPMARIVRDGVQAQLSRLVEDGQTPMAWLRRIECVSEETGLSARVDEILYGPAVDPHS